jgi:5-methylcytosine-specific restriction endonuclease McrA
LTKAERRQVYDKTGGRCAYCGCPIDFDEMQIDHVNPLSLGGADDVSNMLPACRSCNHFKGGMTLEKFRKAIERWPDALMRDSVTYRNAVRFGLAIPNPHKVKFFFGRLEEEEK